MIVIYTKSFFNLIALPWVRGIALFPFVLVRDKELMSDRFCMNHEQIHLRQQAEMLVIFFYLWYMFEFCLKWFIYRDTLQAYRAISFEKEAYDQENNLNYLKQRRFWAFLKYL